MQKYVNIHFVSLKVLPHGRVILMMKLQQTVSPILNRIGVITIIGMIILIVIIIINTTIIVMTIVWNELQLSLGEGGLFVLGTNRSGSIDPPLGATHGHACTSSLHSVFSIVRWGLHACRAQLPH